MHGSTTRDDRRPARRRGACFGLVAAVVVVVGSSLLAGCGPSTGAAPPLGPAAPADPVTATVFTRTNADRAARGLSALGWDARLAGLADDWARYLSDSGEFRHRDLATALDLPGYEAYTKLGENILVGPPGIDGVQMQQAWLASPSHAANIFGDWDSFGMAFARDSAGNVKAVANFGRHG